MIVVVAASGSRVGMVGILVPVILAFSSHSMSWTLGCPGEVVAEFFFIFFTGVACVGVGLRLLIFVVLVASEEIALFGLVLVGNTILPA